MASKIESKCRSGAEHSLSQSSLSITNQNKDYNSNKRIALFTSSSLIICQLSLQHDIKQIRALTKGRSRTKCSIITMIKSSSTRPTEAGQTSCNQWQTAKCAVVKAKVAFLMSVLPSLNARVN